MSAATDSFALDWLNTLLVSASDASRIAIPLKSNGERYAAASMRAAIELNQALKDEEKRRSFTEAVVAILAGPETALPKLVRSVPCMLEPARFSAPNGMFDLPQILTAAHFGLCCGSSASSPVINGDAHDLLLKALNVVLIRVQSSLVTGAISSDRDGFINSLGDRTKWDRDWMPPRIALRMRDTGRDLLPSPAAVIAVLGANPTAALADNSNFYAYVRFIHEKLWARSGGDKIWPKKSLEGHDAQFVQFLWHMRIFLSDSAERLSFAVLTCDRVPVVAPWYAMIILAARAYGMAVHSALLSEPGKPPVPADPVEMTTFTLVAMAAGDVTGNMPNPARALFDAGTKSMYLRMEAQDGPYWVLLRAALSGIDTKQSEAVAQKLCMVKGANTAVCTTAVMLCALMRTQAGMAIFSYRNEKKSGLEAYELASLAADVVESVRKQSVFDFVMNTVSGTLDLEMLSSNDLAFVEPDRIVAAWTGGPLPEIGRETQHVEIVDAWCNCMQAIGEHWTARLGNGSVFAVEPSGKATSVVRAITKQECENTLARAHASQASINHGKWLSMCFKLACQAETNHCSTDAPPLICSHIDLKHRCCTKMRPDLDCDNAWLRLNFRLKSELVLNSARRGGMLTAGNHVVLVAWVAVPPAEASDNGVRIFARALTEHTVAAGATAGRLVQDAAAWRKTVTDRGDDSIVMAALEFERTLQAYNTLELTTYWPAREDVRKAVFSALPKSEAAEKANVALEPLLPHVPITTRARQSAAAHAQGPMRLDAKHVASLDTATDTALMRFRLAATNKAMVDSLFICQEPFEHGVSVAVVSSPAQVDEDLRPAREKVMKVETWRSAEVERTKLLEKLRKFQRGSGPGVAGQ